MSNFSYAEYNVNNELKNIENRILLHLDIDYFFAQVEILKNPDLNGKPVIVGHERARETGRGVVLTCSYEAREFGVHSGLAMKIALERCPKAIIVKSEYSEYKEISSTIMDILRRLEIPLRVAGIDEAYVDITSMCSDYNTAAQIGERLKQEIFEKVNLTVSIGIGPTLKLAKIGSDYNKPNGLTIIRPESVEDIFDGLPLIKIPGIGKKTYQRLKQKGFETCDQLLKMSKADLEFLLGSSGVYYYNILHGKSTNRIKSRGQRKSVSHSRTFVGKPGDIDTSKAVLKRLFESTYNTLIKEKFLTKTVNLRIRFNGFDTITRARSLPFHTNDKEQLFNVVQEVVIPYLDDKRGIRLLGVGFSSLKKIQDNQLSLEGFLDNEEEDNDLISIISGNNKYTAEQIDNNVSLDDFF